MIKVGTCGWSGFPASNLFGKEWKGKFKSKLQAYASVFKVVEVNSTFYKVPREATARRWLEEAREVNSEFEFTLKANQTITHRDRFKTEESTKSWEETVNIARALDAKIILLQTPASFKPSRENTENLESFLREATKSWKGKIAWEPRGNWLKEDNRRLLKSICKRFKLIHCVDPFRNESVTPGEIYWRLHGLGKPRMYNYKFSDEELKWLTKKSKGKKGYIFFNNIWMGEDALRYLDLL